jgi:hypothetical protein
MHRDGDGNLVDGGEMNCGGIENLISMLFYDWGEGWRARVQLQQQVQGGNTTTAAAATMWQGQCRLAIEEHWETLATLWVQCLCGVM